MPKSCILLHLRSYQSLNKSKVVVHLLIVHHRVLHQFAHLHLPHQREVQFWSERQLAIEAESFWLDFE